MLTRRDGQPETRNKYLTSCWMQSETIWASLSFQTMRRMGKTLKMMNNMHSMECSVKMTNPAGWWEKYPNHQRTGWGVLGRSRWCLMNERNWDGGMRPNALGREISSMRQPNWWFQLLSVLKQISLQPHHHGQYLESLGRLLISSAGNRKCPKGCLDQEVVKWGWVWRNHSQKQASRLSCQSWHPMHLRFSNRNLSNPSAVTAAYSVHR